MEDKTIVRYYNTTLSQFGFLSHLPLLTAACMVTTNPVLELGAGFGSTFALHGICSVQKRKLVTLESDRTWLGAFNFYKRPWHVFKHVTNFVDLPEYREEWGLAFVDHGILGERGIALETLRDVPIVVAHDTCHERLNYDNYSNASPLTLFKYRYDYQWQGPKTSALSNSVDVFKLFMELGI